MGNGSGVSRGDRNRDARLEGLRALVPVTNAIVGIDLADAKQMIVVTDHDSKVLARKTFWCRAAWRAVWGAQRANPVYAARFAHLTSREQNRLTATQAQAVIAAAILRQLHAVITTGQRPDPVIATRGTRPLTVTPIAA